MIIASISVEVVGTCIDLNISASASDEGEILVSISPAEARELSRELLAAAVSAEACS